MPELPDLQVFSRNLNKQLAGKKLKEINILSARKLEVPIARIQTELEAATVSSVQRQGKELHIVFDNSHILGLHLMLSGALHLFSEQNEQDYTIAEVCFTDHTGLAFTDPQGLATIKYDPAPPDAPDALNIDTQYLAKGFAGSRSGIKSMLINQKFIRGIGNAYADEILWAARIAPQSVAGKIPGDKVKQLAMAITEVLTHAEQQILKAHPDIITGEVRDFLQIHNPAKKNSPNGADIIQETVASKKTYYTDEQLLYK